MGGSPAAWGNLGRVCWGLGSEGQIPTGVGQPGQRHHRSTTRGEIPTGVGQLCSDPSSAPSGRRRPPLPLGRWGEGRLVGSIPASAGFPRQLLLGAGNPLGPIPASAGSPQRLSRGDGKPGVHPRFRGVSTMDINLTLLSAGPSPLLRGLLWDKRAQAILLRSIPASAGFPPDAHSRFVMEGVHPRVCGVSHEDRVLDGCRNGPSPRLRGFLPAQGLAPAH